MKEKKDLLNKIDEAINIADCCMECLLKEISELIYADTSCHEEIKAELLAIINQSSSDMCDKCKLRYIVSLINEYIER